MLLLIQGYILLKSQFVLNQSETFNRCSKLAPSTAYLLASDIVHLLHVKKL